MTAARRILARDAVWPSMRCERVVTARLLGPGEQHVAGDLAQCHAVIALDSFVYRCGRRGGHAGIHDAFVTHVDGGAVRW